MAKLNLNFQNLPKNYLFFEISKRTRDFQRANPDVEILKLGIGNTTEPLVPAVVEAMIDEVQKLGTVGGYTGYGDEQGNLNLRQAICKWYTERGVVAQEDMENEIFISDGAKSDCANIASIFEHNSVIAITDPVYPVYMDANILSGKKVILMEAKEENGFIPEPPQEHADLIFLCIPNNPTGAVATKEQLKKFTDYCLLHKSILIFDAAYSEYIQDEKYPKSIYQVEGARKCAIEIQSFSKSAGFTGVRLGWTVVPITLELEGGSEWADVTQAWRRRQTTMFNGASNIAQVGGLAALSDKGQRQTHEQIRFYMDNAKLIKEGLENMGLTCFGGENAPYIWVKCPQSLDSWSFFDKLLNEAHVVCTPGSGFGKMGNGYVRFSAFGHRKNIEKAVTSIKENLKL